MAGLRTMPSSQGQLGFLTTEQETRLGELKVLLVERGYLEEGTDDEYTNTTILRFLRARKFNVAEALQQYTLTEDWRRQKNVTELYDDFDLEEFNLTQSQYPMWTGRVDKAGLPVYVFQISKLTKESVSAYSKKEDRLDDRLIALYEHMVHFALPFATELRGASISQTVTIVDVSNVSLSRFWALRSHMQRASVLANARYAETLGRIYLIGAPSMFPVVWGWVKNWFDPGTVEKIFILSDAERLAVLSRFIDFENIPECYGGELRWQYSVDRPILDDTSKEALGLDYLPRGPLRWIHGKGLVIGGSARTEEDLAKLQKSGGNIVIPLAAPIDAPSDPSSEVPSVSTSPASSDRSEELTTPPSASPSTTTLNAIPIAPVKPINVDESEVGFNVDALAAGLTTTKI